MNGQPEAAGSLESAVNAAFAAAIAWQREAREALWRAPSRRQVEATIRAQFERAEAAEAKLAAITDACRSIPSPIANRILAVIGSEEGADHG